MHWQPSFAAGQWLVDFPQFRLVTFWAYLALPIPLMAVFAAQLRLRGREALSVMAGYMLAGVLGAILYNILPATGPVYLFWKSFPFHPLSTLDAMQLKLVPLPIPNVPRNAIPSLHMAWILLAWWNTRGTSRIFRMVLAILVAWTVLATLATGEHYLVDLIVAFPFALMVQAICAYSLPYSSPQRKIPLMFGLLTTLAWFVALSFGTKVFWASPIIPWTMLVATIVSTQILVQRLLVASEARTSTNELAIGTANDRQGGLLGTPAATRL